MDKNTTPEKNETKSLKSNYRRWSKIGKVEELIVTYPPFKNAIGINTSDLRAFYLYNRELLAKSSITLYRQCKELLSLYGFTIDQGNTARIIKKKSNKRSSSMMPLYVIAHWWGLDPLFMIQEGRKIVEEENRMNEQQQQ